MVDQQFTSHEDCRGAPGDPLRRISRLLSCVPHLFLYLVAVVAVASACSAAEVSVENRAGHIEAFVTTDVDEIIQQLSSSTTNLDSLSDDQLIDLYIVASQESLQRQAIDETRLVEPGSVILQSGYTFTHDRDDLDFTWETHTFPETLLRYRVCESVELRVGWAGTTIETVTDEVTALSQRDRSDADPSFGARFAIRDQQGWVPRTALTVSTPVELKTSTSLASRFSPVTTFSYTWLCEESWLFSGSSGLAWVTDGNERFLDFQQSLSVDYLINHRWDVFVEWFAMVPDGSSGSDIRHFSGPGLSYAVTPNLQLGLSASFGLTEAAADFTSQLRVTWRP